MTGNLIINATEDSTNTTQNSLLKVISTNKSSENNIWTGRFMIGAEDLTFLLGTYKGMAGIGAHSWSSAMSETGSGWAPIYFNPDGNAPIIFGANGPGWTENEGTLIVKGNNTTKGAGQVIINGTLNGGIPYTTINLKEIFGRSIDLSTGKVAGKGTFYGTYNSTPGSRFTTSALEIRENSLVTNNQNDIGYAPSIGFHWGNQGAGTLLMDTSQIFYFRKQDGVSRATIDANLRGNADTATTSTYISSLLGDSNAARHVFFAYYGDDVSKRRIVYNNNFQYNPSTDTLTVGKITGAAAKLSAVPAGHWYNQVGVLARKYEGEDSTTYKLPNQYCTILSMTQGSNRGSAIALDWRDGNNNIYFNNLHDDTGTWQWGGWRRIWMEGNSVTGAVWNDYAECREADTIEPGYVLIEIGDDTLTKSTERLQSYAGVSSDTWGFSQGETDRAKTPIAVAGRVLVYPFQERENYKPGQCVCAAPGGTVDIMTEEEIVRHPDRIVGTVSCVPTYDTWGGGPNADRPEVAVNGRIWIKVK